MRSSRLLTSFALVALATACGGESDDGTGPTISVPATVEVTALRTTLAAIGDTLRAVARVLDENARVVPGVHVAWSSSDTDVATVSDAGLVTARANGSATITATLDAIAGQVTIAVLQAAGSVLVNPGADTLFDGQSTALAAAVADANGHEVQDVLVTWSSSDTLVATVDSTGNVLARYPGTATITAAAGAARGRSRIVVLPVAAGLEVAAGADQLAVAGDSLTRPLRFRVFDRHGIPVPGQEIRLSLTTGNGVLHADRVMTGADGTARVQLDVAAATGAAEPLTVEAEVTLTNGSASASATFYVRRPVLLYSQWNGAGFELVRYDWLTKQPAVISRTGSIIDAASAPDGSAIAYSAYNYQTGYYDLYLHSWATGKERLIHGSASGNSRAASFSTDGRYLAFEIGDRCHSLTTIALYDLKFDVLLSEDLASSSCAITPAFVSASQLVYAEFGGDQFDLWRLEVPSGKAVRVTTTPEVDEYYPFRITDNRVITACVLLSQNLFDLCALNLDGGSRAQLTTTNDQSEWDPTVSYDGAWFAFTVTVPGFDPGIGVSPTKGGAITKLPRSGQYDARYPNFGLIGWNGADRADLSAASAGPSLELQPGGPAPVFTSPPLGRVATKLRDTPLRHR
jgi:Tol biopolymer transport system component